MDNETYRELVRNLAATALGAAEHLRLLRAAMYGLRVDKLTGEDANRAFFAAEEAVYNGERRVREARVALLVQSGDAERTEPGGARNAPERL